MTAHEESEDYFYVRVCVACKSGDDIAKPWIGAIKMMSECGSTIIVKKNEIDHICVSPLEDKSAATVIQADTFYAFFKFKYENKCLDKIKCSLKKKGCATAYTGSNI